MSANRKIIYLVILLVLAGGFIYWYKQPVYLEINGNLVGVGTNSIILNGAFDKEEDKQVDSKDFEVEIIESTKITRTVFIIPTEEGMFLVSDLEREESIVGFETLKLDSDRKVTIGMQIILQKGIFGKPKMVAEEINYRLQKYDNVVPPII